MELVIDANILFAALIKQNVTSDLIFSKDLYLYAPEFLFDEFVKYKNLIKQKTGASEEEIELLIKVFQRRITVVLKEDIEEFILSAKKISPDEKDIPYVALALKLEVPIWSNDNDLKFKQNRIKVMTTNDILKNKLKY
jgi:predicted nucleic acid-binding protein